MCVRVRKYVGGGGRICVYLCICVYLSVYLPGDCYNATVLQGLWMNITGPNHRGNGTLILDIFISQVL